MTVYKLVIFNLSAYMQLSDGYIQARMGTGITSIRAREAMILRLQTQGITNQNVLEAMLQTPRHLFVDECLAPRAYDDTALPIGYGQTISQPYIVAKMISMALEGRRNLECVLEVGAGCGYQTAVLSRLAKQVYSVERINFLVQSTKLRLHHLGYFNARVRHEDGQSGLEYYAPYQAILVAASAANISENLCDQLDIGGRLIAPVGVGKEQFLVMIEKTNAGFKENIVEPCSFVPLLSGLA